MTILIIDNYDSFVYNLARYFNVLEYSTQVHRNDAISLDDIRRLNPSHIVISPGPCTPNEAGISLEIVRNMGHSVPILGVCLGHQVIGQAFGAKITRAKKPMHGMSSAISHSNKDIFASLPNPFLAGRYHSLVISPINFPENELQIIAHSEENEIMAVQHRRLPILGTIPSGIYFDRTWSSPITTVYTRQMNTDTLYIEKLKLKAYLGVYPWEQEIKRSVYFDIEFPVNAPQASLQDNLADTINYEVLYHHLEKLLESTRFQLIETLAEKSAALLLEMLPLPWIKLKVSKPYAIPQANSISISITRYSENSQ